MSRTYRTTANPISAIRNLLAFNARDWACDKGDAWLWGIVFGWDDDETLDESAMREVALKHGWDDFDIATLMRLHANFEKLEFIA